MTDVRALKDKATQLVSKGKLDAALEVWRQVAAQAPDEVAAQQKVAELLHRLGRDREAVETYEKVAGQYAERGLFFKASAICRLLLTIEPVHQKTQELIAELYARGRQQPQTTARSLPRADPQPAPADVLGEEVELAPPPKADLPTIPLFSTLSAAELKEVLSGTMEVRSISSGEAILAEGAPGASMFALVEGSAGVYRGHGTATKRRVASLTGGDIFGEAAMVSGAPRLATVLAETDVIVLEFPRDLMAKVIAKHPLVGQKLDLFYRQRLLQNVLRASPVLRALPTEAKDALTRRFQATAFVAGQVIIQQGEKVDSVQMLLRGVCMATHSSGNRYPDLREGDLFGEVSALTDGFATASVTAAGPVLTLRLPAAEFRQTVLADPTAARAVQALADERLARTAAHGSEQDDGGVDLRI